ncbi:hypothetical protein HDV02_005216, partial [Globomyces sp. JEL0801]
LSAIEQLELENREMEVRFMKFRETMAQQKAKRSAGKSAGDSLWRAGQVSRGSLSSYANDILLKKKTKGFKGVGEECIDASNIYYNRLCECAKDSQQPPELNQSLTYKIELKTTTRIEPVTNIQDSLNIKELKVDKSRTVSDIKEPIPPPAEQATKPNAHRMWRIPGVINDDSMSHSTTSISLDIDDGYQSLRHSRSKPKDDDMKNMDEPSYNTYLPPTHDTDSSMQNQSLLDGSFDEGESLVAVIDSVPNLTKSDSVLHDIQTSQIIPDLKLEFNDNLSYLDKLLLKNQKSMLNIPNPEAIQSPEHQITISANGEEESDSDLEKQEWTAEDEADLASILKKTGKPNADHDSKLT